MILLDTNYLIALLVPHSPESQRVRSWIQSEEDLCTSAVSWYEFVTGPVSPEGIGLVSEILDHRIVPYTEAHAVLSAELWNATGRRRNLRIDSMIAATALALGAQLATANTADFTAFTAHGLNLVVT